MPPDITPSPLDLPPCANHLDRPAELLCARCGDFLCITCNRAGDGAEPLCAGCVKAAGRVGSAVPWENRETIGTIEAYGQTVWRSLSAPRAFFQGSERSLRPDGYYGYIATNIFSYISSLLIRYGSWPRVMSSSSHDLKIGAIDAFCFVVFSAIYSILFWIAMEVVAGPLSLACRRLGGGQGTRLNTARGLAYTTGPLVVMAVVNVILRLISQLDTTLPGVADVCATVGTVLTSGTLAYITVLVVFALRAVHGFSTGRAIAASAAFVLVFGAITLMLGNVFAILRWLR